MNAFDIFKLAHIFFKRATFRSDMAERIMYSTLPALKEHGHQSKDLNALKRAMAGIPKLIYHGALACVFEYNQLPPGGKKITTHDLPEVNSVDSLKAIENYLTHIANAFETQDDEDSDIFGGPQWARICNTLNSAVKEFAQYLSAKQEENYDDMFRFGEMCLAHVNHFDQLAHNTSGIYQKLVKYELMDNPKEKQTAEEYRGDFARKHMSELEKVNRLMDVKELDSSPQVVRKLEDELEIPAAYKPYIGKARQDKEYRDLEGIENKLELIQERKRLIAINESIIEFTQKRIEKLLASSTDVEKVKHIEELISNIELILRQINTRKYSPERINALGFDSFIRGLTDIGAEFTAKKFELSQEDKSEDLKKLCEMLKNVLGSI